MSSTCFVNENNSNSNKHNDDDEDDEGVSADIIKTFRNSDGSVSSYFDKRKVRIAPRSTLQFKIGPSFSSVVRNHSIIDDETGLTQTIRLLPRIDRGFDYIEDEWIGYKRNYFTVVTAFDTPGINHEDFMKKSFSLDDGLEIQYFATKLAAKCLEDDKLINLVQHTAKRDKGPQFPPPVHAIAPAMLPKHQIIRDASNVRNESKMKRFDNYFFLHREEAKENCNRNSVLNKYPADTIKKVARYERIQFASSIALKKTSQQNRRFSLLVILGCFIKGRLEGSPVDSPYYELDHYDPETDMTFVPLVMERTPPLIIRGRSPSNYCQQIKVMHTKKTDYESIKEDDLEVASLEKKEKKKRGRKSKQKVGPLAEELNSESLTNFPAIITGGLPSTFEISPNGGTMKIKNLSIHSSSTDASFPRGIHSESLSVAYLSNSGTPIQDSIFKKRKLNISKPTVLESNMEEPADDVSDNLFNTISFEDKSPIKDSKDIISSTSVFLLKHVTYNATESPCVSIPRAMLHKKMEISYCLNEYSSGFLEEQPPSTSGKRLNVSRRLLTASGNPSDFLNPADWSDGPSIFHH